MKSAVIAWTSSRLFRQAGVLYLGLLLPSLLLPQSVHKLAAQSSVTISGSGASARSSAIAAPAAEGMSIFRQRTFNSTSGSLPGLALHSEGQGRSAITEVEQIRQLGQKEAARAVPVRITGVITAFSGYKNSFFLQDATAGISVDRTDDAEAQVGDRVEVTGVSGAGMFAPVILASFVHVIGRFPVPAARRVTYSDLFGGALDSQWIEMEGVVHSAGISKVFQHDTLVVALALSGGPVRVLLQDYDGLNYAQLVDATIRVKGVCSTSFNEKRQFVGLGLFVPDHRDITVLEPAVPEPFAEPATPIRNALQFGQRLHRLKVTGVATYQAPDHTLYLQNGTDGIKIQTSSKLIVDPGKKVEALGFAVMGEYAPLLVDGVVRVVGEGQRVRPDKIDIKSVIAVIDGFVQAPYDQQLVQMQGTVVESHTQGDQRVWILRQQGQIYEAYLPLSQERDLASKLRPGSILLLAGICTVHTDADRIPVSFSLLLRSPQDIVVLKSTPWWTPIHTLFLVAALTGITIAVILWVVILRSRVRGQTRIIRESEERYRALAHKDVLTGLPNRLMLEDRVAQCLALSKAAGLKAAILTIDVDRFKHVNDTYGHLIADQCLKTVAFRLGGRVRQVDAVARIGGEEFILAVSCLGKAEDAKTVASNLLNLFENPVKVPGHEIKITISIGGAIYPDDGVNSETLFKRSDQALYEAKKAGRNRVVFANDDLSRSSDMATSIESALRNGLQAGSFLLHYQAIYDGAGAIHHFEALLRTTDELLIKTGLDSFIPVAEESGLILPLGRWVLEQACRQMAEWRASGMDYCQVAVNVSGRQLLHAGFADEVLQILRRFQIDPAMLQLELTETTLMTELAAVSEAVARLAQAGVAFAIDDFGTGYSSLSRLGQLPIRTLKIDRSFVHSLLPGGGSCSIVQAIIQMARSLHVQVIAEGVETPDQFTILEQMGCELYQGYLFARPAPPAVAIQALAENRTEVRGEALMRWPPSALLRPSLTSLL